MKTYKITLLTEDAIVVQFTGVPEDAWETKNNPPEVDFKTAGGRRIVSNLRYVIEEEPVEVQVEISGAEGTASVSS